MPVKIVADPECTTAEKVNTSEQKLPKLRK
jgi:hypothetical protein